MTKMAKNAIIVVEIERCSIAGGNRRHKKNQSGGITADRSFRCKTKKKKQGR